jgi:hypothetical protein
MPKIFQYLNYAIRFYSNDHLPIHVHVQVGRAESKVDFLIEGNNVILIFKKVKGKKPVTLGQAREVGVFLKAYQAKIIEKWERVFIRKESINCEIIRSKVKRK